MTKGRRAVLAGLVVLVLAGAAAGVLVARDSGPPPSPGPPLGDTALRYRLVDAFAPIFFCDPDYYPVGSEEQERVNADAWWSSVDPAGDEVATIAARLGVSAPIDDADVLSIYREHKLVSRLVLEPANGEFGFTVISGDEAEAVEVTGTIARDGSTHVDRREPAIATCPICLAAGTLIDTPDGPLPVEQVRAGMRVWTADEHGDRVQASVVRTVRRSAPGMPLVRVTLADGRRVVAAGAHPTADGRLLGALTAGDPLDGSSVVVIEAVPAPDGATYDLLPSGTTGGYWANGILLGSTLRDES